MPITQPVKWTEIKNKPTTVAGSGLADAATVTQATNAANPGTVAWFAASTAPDGWIKANGAEVSRSTYAGLFAAIGTAYGAGNGSTTFNVPDLRGEFVRGFDDGRGIDSGRGIASWQGDSLQNITGSIGPISETFAQTAGMSEEGSLWKSNSSFNGSFTPNLTDTGPGGILSFDASRSARTSSETRPRNLALLACIKY